MIEIRTQADEFQYDQSPWVSLPSTPLVNRELTIKSRLSGLDSKNQQLGSVAAASRPMSTAAQAYYPKQHASQRAQNSTFLKPDEPGNGSSTEGNYFSSVAHKSATSGLQDTDTSEQSVSESGFSTWTDYLESDIEPCYEGYEALDPLRRTLACCLLEAYQARSSEPRSYGTGDSGQPYTSRFPSGFAAGKSLTSTSSGKSSGKKRLRNQQSPGDGSGSPDDGEGPSKIPRNGKTHKDLRILACPFYKKDPRKYRCCNQHVLREINRVK